VAEGLGRRSWVGIRAARVLVVRAVVRVRSALKVGMMGEVDEIEIEIEVGVGGVLAVWRC